MRNFIFIPLLVMIVSLCLVKSTMSSDPRPPSANAKTALIEALDSADYDDHNPADDMTITVPGGAEKLTGKQWQYGSAKGARGV